MTRTVIALDSAGNFYVVDCFNNRVRKLSGSSWGTIGSFGDFPNGVPCPNRGIAVDSEGSVYVVIAITQAGGSLSTNIAKLSGGSWATVATENSNEDIWGIAVDSGCPVRGRPRNSKCSQT